jgi:hypothetical protein
MFQLLSLWLGCSKTQVRSLQASVFGMQRLNTCFANLLAQLIQFSKQAPEASVLAFELLYQYANMETLIC